MPLYQLHTTHFFLTPLNALSLINSQDLSTAIRQVVLLTLEISVLDKRKKTKVKYDNRYLKRHRNHNIHCKRKSENSYIQTKTFSEFTCLSCSLKIKVLHNNMVSFMDAFSYAELSENFVHRRLHIFYKKMVSFQYVFAYGRANMTFSEIHIHKPDKNMFSLQRVFA